tara:strand:- start:1491 stop:3035 length:1545 start_codon:yes stop_codon:yes gene_type:complete
MLIVNNVVSSSLQVTYDYLETSELFGYSVAGTYIINVSDIQIEQGDTVLLKGREAIEKAYERQNITARIGADDYVNGRITSFSFDSSSLVGSETVSITIEESRPLDDYSAKTFGQYIPNPHDLESFSETYSFSRSGGTYSSTRNISIAYKQKGAESFLENAKTFLTNYYFGVRPDFGYQEDGISEKARLNKGFRGVITETYDLLGLTVSIEEKLNSSFIDQSKAVGKKETQSIEIGEQGFLTKTFNFELTSLRRDSENVIESAMSEIVDDLKAAQEDEFGSPFSISKTIKKDGNSGNLVVSFSTDPKKSSENIISYSGTETKQGAFKNYSLTISFNSSGKNNTEKFQNSRNLWVSEQTYYKEKIRRLFHPVEEFFEKERDTTFSRADGKVNETVTFTTDNSYNTTQDGLLKLKKTISKTQQINRIEKFLDLSHLQDQVVVKDSLKTLGSANVTAQATVSQSMGIYEAKNLLESKTAEFDELVDENTIHMVSDTISLSLGDGTASRNIEYIYKDD